MYGLAMTKIIIFLLLLQGYGYELQRLKSPNAVSLISMGMNDTKNKYPYILKIHATNEKGQGSVCTGSLISSSWVLTAAHCLEATPVTVTRFTNYTLYRNVTNQNVYRPVLQKFIHPNYTEYFHVHDIGLLKIKKFKMKKYGIIGTENPKDLIGRRVWYAGFGKISPWNISKGNDTGGLAKVLQLGYGSIIECPPHSHPVHKLHICISGRILEGDSSKVQTTRPGDSGGPCFYKGKILGVASSHLYLDNPAASFMPVFPYLSWIKNITAIKYIDVSKNTVSNGGAKEFLNPEENDSDVQSENEISKLKVMKNVIKTVKCILAS